MTYQQAKQHAINLTGITPRWCDVRDDNDELAPAPIPEAMNNCIALDAMGNETRIERWQDQQPCGVNIEAVCYF